MKNQQYFFLSDDRTKNPPGLILENEDKIMPPGHSTFGIWDIRRRGIPPAKDVPRFVYKKKEGRLPQDIENFQGLWLLTERTKSIFEEADPMAFEFIECEVVFNPSHEIVRYWLCDVVRVLDALEEDASDVFIKYGAFGKHYNILESKRLVFNPSKIGTAHIFRMNYNFSQVVCSKHFETICKSAKIKNVKLTSIVR